MIRCALLIGNPDLDPASVLTGPEAGLLGPRAVPKRHNDFLRGRWIGKKLLGSVAPGAGLRDLLILPDDRGVPCPFDAHGALPWSLSLSHTEGFAAAAITPLPGLVGIDVERPIPEPSLVAQDYFTDRERSFLVPAGDRASRVAAVIWSAKEAASKALGEGLRLSLLAMEVSDAGPLEPSSWHPLRMSISGHPPLSLWSWHEQGAVVTVASVGMGDAALPRWELRV